MLTLDPPALFCLIIIRDLVYCKNIHHIALVVASPVGSVSGLLWAVVVSVSTHQFIILNSLRCAFGHYLHSRFNILFTESLHTTSIFWIKTFPLTGCNNSSNTLRILNSDTQSHTYIDTDIHREQWEWPMGIHENTPCADWFVYNSVEFVQQWLAFLVKQPEHLSVWLISFEFMVWGRALSITGKNPVLVFEMNGHLWPSDRVRNHRNSSWTPTSSATLVSLSWK